MAPSRGTGVATGRRLGIAAAAATVFAAIAVLNLVAPEPRGPADQGDFTRIFAAFSSGPAGLPLWPPPGDPLAERRFYHQYLRAWSYGEAPADLARPSTSHLVFLPERGIDAVRGGREFDLATNALLVILALALALFAALATLAAPLPIAALALSALLAADLRVSWYLNSFYTEAGGLVFALLFLCLAFAWWQTRSRLLLAGALAALALLGGAKLPYAPSAVPPALALCALALPVRSWRFAASAVAIALAVVVAMPRFFAGHRERTAFDNAYHFVFVGALPRLEPAERGGYLASLGLDPQLATASGVIVYDPAAPAHDPALRAKLGALQATAIWTLARRHPAAFARLVADGFAEAGRYDVETQYGYAWRSREAQARPEPPAWRGWSALRAAWLRGLGSYAALLGALSLVTWRSRGADRASWRRFLVAIAWGCLAGSALQCVVTPIGNGTVDMRKQLYLANLLFDFALVGTLAAALADRDRAPAAPRATVPRRTPGRVA